MMASNHGFPPPPPPPPPPPQPPQYLYTAPSQGIHANGLPPSSRHAQAHHVQPPVPSMMHPSNPQFLQHRTFQQLNPANSYSHSQYPYYQTSQLNYQAQLHQQTPYYNYSQSSYAPYANYTAPPPPPPPPRSTNNNQQIVDTRSTLNGTNKLDIKVASHHSSPSPTKNLNNDQPKKINDKMVKKYSGRGLKTITISGPGVRPQKFKICVGDHPDDIKKWIDERKRRFPRRDGSHKTVGDAPLATSGSKRNRNDETERNVAQKQSCVGDRELIESAATSNNKPGENSGLSSLLEGYDSSSSDDGNVESKSKATTADVGPPMEDAIAKSSTLAVESSQSQPKRICKYHQRGNCRHGDSCKFLHSNDVDEYLPNQRQKQKISSQSDRDKARNRYEEELKMLGLVAPGHGSRYSGGEKVISSTSLLHKLLQRDKERERRLTLQLLRYIVDCDYFRDGDKSEPVCDGVSETT